MAYLSLAELKKRPGRIETLVSKLARNDIFETNKGKLKANQLVHYKGKELFKVYSKDVKNAGGRALNSASTTDIFYIKSSTNSVLIKLTELIKSGEFGGKGEGGGLVAESRAISQLQISLQKAIKENGGPITVSVGNKKYKNIIDVVKTNGVPKSDFHLVDTTGKAVIWCSHKDGSTAKDFQQWGGVSEKSEPIINKHKEVQKFINDIKLMFPHGLKDSVDKTLYRKIKDPKLKMLSVYGNQFGSTMGEQNVTVLLQGDIGFAKTGAFYIFTSAHSTPNGASVDQNGYEPVLMAINKGDRSDAGIPGVRLVISPVGGRKGKEFP
jgi:hypothetical protein